MYSCRPCRRALRLEGALPVVTGLLFSRRGGNVLPAGGNLSDVDALRAVASTASDLIAAAVLTSRPNVVVSLLCRASRALHRETAGHLVSAGA